jgi:hypothetical protein
MPEYDSSPIECLITSLKRNAHSLHARGLEGELLVIEDLFVNVAPLPDGVKIFCLDTDTSIPPGDLSEKGISPGLSFLWTSGGIEKFGSAERLRNSVSKFLSDEVGKIVIGKITFKYLPNNSDITQLVHALSSGVEALVSFSLNALNKSQDLADALSRDLLLEVARVGGRFGLSELAQFLGQKTELSFGLLHLTRAPDGLAIMTASRECSSDASLTSLSEFIGFSLESLLVETNGVPNPFPTVSLPQTVGAELIVNTARGGKALSSAMPYDPRNRILIIPITRHLGPKADHTGSGVFAASDLLFAFMQGLSRDLIESLCAAVNTFSQHRFGARRFSLLSRLQEGFPLDQQDTHQIANSSNKLSGSARLREFVLSVLNEVMYTTSAHSVSLRLYDPKTQTLAVEALADPDAKNNEGVGLPIPLKNNGQTSVAAFIFLNGGPKLPYVYLKRLSKPRSWQIKGRSKVRHSTFIPEEYKLLGLLAPLITRPTTRSEICFTLLKDTHSPGPNNLAFGTLNLEAPFPSAFDNDIPYLRLVNHGIERLYNSVADGFDHRWLISNGAWSDAIHELWGLIEDKQSFTPEQERRLLAILPQRSQLWTDEPTNLQALRDKVLAWAEVRYGSNEEQKNKSITEMIKFDHLTDCLVKNTFFESAFVILRNIIQNVVKHGEYMEDLLFIDDRKWFGASTRSCLRIHYQSFKPVGDAVIESLGKTPIQLENKRIAYGMYNVGLLTRLLGGNLHVYDPGTKTRFVIEIHLPYEQEKRERQ